MKRKVLTFIALGALLGGVVSCGKPTGEQGGEGNENAIPAPTGLNATKISDGKVQLKWNWEGTSTKVKYEVEFEGEETWSGTVSFKNVSPVEASSLVVGKVYPWRVRATVGEDVSDWAESTYSLPAPLSTVFLGDWLMDTKNMTAMVNVAMLGNPIPLTTLLTAGGQGGDDVVVPDTTTATFSAVAGEADKVQMNMDDLGMALPFPAGAGVVLDVNDKSRSASIVQTYDADNAFKMNIPLPEEGIKVGDFISSVGGTASDISGIMNATITAVTITITSATLTASLGIKSDDATIADPLNNDKIQFTPTMDASIDLEFSSADQNFGTIWTIIKGSGNNSGQMVISIDGARAK